MIIKFGPWTNVMIHVPNCDLTIKLTFSRKTIKNGQKLAKNYVNEH